MSDFNFNIRVELKEDFRIIVALLKEKKLKLELFQKKSDNSYIIRFESDIEENEFLKNMEKNFSQYQKVEEISTGRYDIKIHVNFFRSSFATDDWNRPLPEIDKDVYFTLESP